MRRLFRWTKNWFKDFFSAPVRYQAHCGPSYCSAADIWEWRRCTCGYPIHPDSY